MRALLATALLAAACGSGATSDPGTDALLRVDGASFHEGALPAPNGGPAVVSANVSQNTIPIGSRDHPVSGALGSTGTAALVGLRGDVGYWILPAGAPDANAPRYPTFRGTMELSSSVVPGALTLLVAAADAAGKISEPATIALEAVPASLAEGTLVVSLSWDDDADLDLHVVIPDGTEIFARDINSVKPPPPGKPVDPHAFQSGGVLDFDSNADCLIDGRRLENVVWTVPPPSGKYVVRVDTFSLCAETAARWQVTAVLRGRVLGVARGESVPSDTALPHDRGAGVLALGFDVP